MSLLMKTLMKGGGPRALLKSALITTTDIPCQGLLQLPKSMAAAVSCYSTPSNGSFVFKKCSVCVCVLALLSFFHISFLPYG
jgi:hypothetical protein